MVGIYQKLRQISAKTSIADKMNNTFSGKNGLLASEHPGPKAILFDWDNTLVDTWPCIIHTMNATLHAMGHAAWSAQEAKQRIAKSLRDTFPVLFGDRWEDARDIFYAELEKCHLNMLTLLPDVDETLRFFEDRKIPVGIISNKTGRYLRAEINALGWQDRFTFVAGAGDFEKDKPAPNAVFGFLERVKLAPAPDIWFVGDSPVDVETAYAAGCTSIFLRGGGEHVFPHEKAPHFEIENCQELSKLAEISLSSCV